MKAKLIVEIEVEGETVDEVKKKVVVKACQLAGHFIDDVIDVIHYSGGANDRHGRLMYGLKPIYNGETES